MNKIKIYKYINFINFIKFMEILSKFIFFKRNKYKCFKEKIIIHKKILH